jgi:small-conductance mechanosensitive channel
MTEFLQELLLTYIAPIGIAFLIAWVIHRIARHLATSLGSSMTGYIPPGLRIREERSRTLNDLTASLISFIAFVTAGIFALGRFIDTTTLIWMVGLFSAAFGLGARPLISDFLTGLSFMVEDTVQIGEKVEILNVQGTVERINLRTTMVRAQTGELYVIPNGEIRVIRNFSRGKFSSSHITLHLPSETLPQILPLLDTLGKEAATTFPDLIEPWRIINESGSLGQNVELTLTIQAEFGHAAALRVKLLAFLQERLTEANITLET